ncbi:MAG: 16S rRNA (guanine(527)-N(7))-methyltransferase RsmG [Chloroflexota bacterium]|nr:16S rRNA (guanine(527)-N(7))-methyltransferase RsmG [Chloroflexota bacterium]
MIASSDEPRRQLSTQHSADDAAGDRQRMAAIASWPGLAPAAHANGVPLSADQLAQFATYRRVLLEWNARFNLTAITDPDEIERRLFLDALLLVPLIDRLTGANAARLVDIGSGAGFPGLPLAIARPKLTMTLIDATGKKVAFLRRLIIELSLPRVDAIHGRAEDIARQPDHRGAYDLATARAVASLPALVELTMPLLRLGGHALLPKGIDIAGELAAGRRAASLLGATVLDAGLVPDSSTRIVIVGKRHPTPDLYPRRAGIPAREPLGTVPPAPQSRGEHDGAAAELETVGAAAGHRGVAS